MLKSRMMQFHVIIPAAGTGSRMANVLPKQYMPLAGKPIISHTIEVFFNNPRISRIHLALSADDTFWRSLSLDPASKLKLHYTGGNSRSETVLNSLQTLLNDNKIADDDWVLVHDAARPGLTSNLLNHFLNTLEHDAVGGLLALPVADTLKEADAKSRIVKTIPRDSLWQAQTPQMFRAKTLQQALQSFAGAPTDEAQAIEALGFNPKLVQGELRNMKVTFPQDLELLELLFAAKTNEVKA
jgi:2-C-methyl-D-erythritol 4-phosphate cytidylyltransferase